MSDDVTILYIDYYTNRYLRATTGRRSKPNSHPDVRVKHEERVRKDRNLVRSARSLEADFPVDRPSVPDGNLDASQQVKAAARDGCAIPREPIVISPDAAAHVAVQRIQT